MEVAADRAAEAARDEPSDAGAASERFEVRPQADNPADAETGDASQSSGKADAGGMFSALFAFDAFSTTDTFAIGAAALLFDHHREQFDDLHGSDGLVDIDDLIGHEVAEMEGLIEEMRAEIISRYAGYMIAARKTVPRNEIMGVIAALKAERNGELARAKAMAAEVLSKRIRDRLEERRAMRRGPRPPDARA